MNKEHEVTLEDEGLIVTVKVEWNLRDDSFDTHKVYSTTTNSFDIISVADRETGEDRPDVNACLADLEKEWEDEITSLLNDGECTPEPPTQCDFKQEKDEHDAESRMEDHWLD
jgi:hypothetical protein